jgi:hypothetical protein
MKMWKVLCGVMAVVMLMALSVGCRHGSKQTKTSAVPSPAAIRLG